MNTIILKTNKECPDKNVIEKAAGILRDGGLVAFPTETVYGLGGDGMNGDAAARIYAAKGRPSDNPLILHIADMDALKDIAKEIPASAIKLAERFWPGPLTMILKKSEAVPYSTTGGLDTVAIRMPSHPVAAAIIRASGCYIAAPSANISGRPSPTTAAHVIEDLNGRIDMIVDGGRADIGLESTIVDLSEAVPQILRPGYIGIKKLSEVLPDVKLDPGITLDTTARPKAPGMKYKHYAPKGDITVVKGEKTAVIKTINEEILKYENEGKKVAVIASEDYRNEYKCGNVYVIGSKDNTEAVAHNLYCILRQLDSDKMEIIFAESFSSGDLSRAIMNRLLKAAGHHVIEAKD